MGGSFTPSFAPACPEGRGCSVKCVELWKGVRFHIAMCPM